jgi:hypothetical protein
MVRPRLDVQALPFRTDRTFGLLVG